MKNAAAHVPDDSESLDLSAYTASMPTTLTFAARLTGLRAAYALAVAALLLLNGCTGVTTPAVVVPSAAPAAATQSAPASADVKTSATPVAPAAPGAALQAPPAPAQAAPSAPVATSPAKAAPPSAKAGAPASAPSPSAQKKESAAPETANQKAPPLDLALLEQRLKETPAIGVLTKITLKNQVDDLLAQFRNFYAGKLKTTLGELRHSYDLLVLKVLSLLQDSDAALAAAIAGSREAIWGILSDPAKFAKI